ncbi:MAG: hypothetical protein VKI81_00475, partial [Synechococcaceae cyanobacterium]|nr:hypothetical protein [Synechococcaceae cyanobacterium]
MRLLPIRRLVFGLGGLSVLAGVGAALPHLSGPLARAASAPRLVSPFPPPPEAAGIDDVPPPPVRTVALPTDPSLPRSSDGRHYPLIPRDAAALATLLVSVEEALRAETTPAADLPALGHQQQVIYR